MTTKTFKIAGYSKLANGQYKARFANTTSKARIALLERTGMTEVTFVELPHAMTKVAAVNHLLATLENIPAGAGVALKHVLNRSETEVSVPVTPKASKTKAPKAKAEVQA